MTARRWWGNPPVVAWAIRVILLLPFVVQGGALRACQVQELLAGVPCAGAGVSSTCASHASGGWSADERPQDSEPCFCDYGKGLSRPVRSADAGDTYVAAPPAVRVPVVILGDAVWRELPVGAAPEPPPPDAGRSLPLLI